MKETVNERKDMTLQVSLTKDEWQYVKDMQKAHPGADPGICTEISGKTLNKIKVCDSLSVCIKIKEEE